MKNEDFYDDMNNYDSDTEGKEPEIPIIWVVMTVTLILIFSAFMVSGLRSAEETERIAYSSAAMPDSSASVVADESIDAVSMVDTPEKIIVQPMAREANRYLVYPEKYEIELKSFPEEFLDGDKKELTDSLGRYAYEEGFKCESAEYSSGLYSNAAYGFRVFGMSLNGMDDFYVTAIREPEQGEYLFIMDQRTLDTARNETPADREDESRNRNSAVTVTPAPTVTKKPTATPSPRPTATPIPAPTSDYQPDIIEIRGIPGEIADAIESPEEFRNSLYNFMYENDISGTVILADVYFEKYGDSIFDFTLNVSEKTVYARYDASLNEYYYSFEKFE